jgi:hypothetical protein
MNKPQDSNGEWEKLCLQIADEYAPKEGEFPPSPLKSQKIQRQEFVQSAAKILQMAEYRENLSTGIATLLADVEIKEPVTELLNAYIEGLDKGFNIDKLHNNDVDLAGALNLNKETLVSIEQKGRSCMAEQHWYQALGIFTLLTLLEYNTASHWFYRSMTACTVEKHEEALAAIDVALMISSLQPEYYIIKCASLLQLNRKEEAAEALKGAENNIAEHKLSLAEEWEEWKKQLKSAIVKKQ